MLRVCRKRLAGRPPEDAEDAASFASERLYARLLSGPHVTDVRALAVRIALNTCIDHYRRQYRQAPEQAWDAEKLERLSAPDDIVQQVDDRLRLKSVAERMTPDQRAVAAGRALGLSSGEIGAAIGKSANAVDAHGSRIRKTYSEEFDQ
jgi:RNA polymerase sigma factor (sigma-70 family)